MQTVLSFLHLARSRRGRSHNNLRNETRSLLVRAGNLALKFRDRFRSNEVNCAATEAAARHSRSEHAVQLSSKVNHKVQLGTTDLKIFAQAEVRSAHQLSKLRKVSGFEGPGGIRHALVLGNDVAASPVDCFGKAADIFLQVA